MSAELVPFPEPTPATAAAIEALKALIQHMEDGDVDSWCFVAMRRDGRALRGHGWDIASPSSGRRWALLGATQSMVDVIGSHIKTWLESNNATGQTDFHIDPPDSA